MATPEDQLRAVCAFQAGLNTKLAEANIYGHRADFVTKVASQAIIDNVDLADKDAILQVVAKVIDD